MNGLLQVIPLRWTQSAAFEPMFAAAESDIQTLYDGLHLQFPVVCLHAGLEEVTGLSQFIERGKDLDSRFRDSRAGSRFPAGVTIDEKSAGWVIERGLQWFRDWVYAEFAKNLASPQNRQLYQFLCALSIRRDRLARELRTIVGSLVNLRLTGCYFAATGTAPAQQAFVHGVIQRLMSEQNDVAWNPQWRSRDQRLLWLTLFVALITFGILGVDIYSHGESGNERLLSRPLRKLGRLASELVPLKVRASSCHLHLVLHGVALPRRQSVEMSVRGDGLAPAASSVRPFDRAGCGHLPVFCLP